MQDNDNYVPDSEPMTQDAPLTNEPIQQRPPVMPMTASGPVPEQAPPAANQAQPVQYFQPAQSTAPYIQPAGVQSDTTYGVSTAPQKTKKKWLVPVVALLSLLLLGGGASAYYVAVFQKPESVLFDAFNKLTAAQAVQSNSVITINKNLSQALTLKDIKINSATAGEAGMFDATVNMEFSGKAVSVGGKVMGSLSDSALYFQLNNLKEALQAAAGVSDTSGEIPENFFDGIKDLQDQWVKVTVGDVKKQNQAYGSNLECVINVVKKHQKDSNTEVVELYKKNPFVAIKESLGVKDGRLGYKLGFDEAKSDAFGKSLEGTQLIKDMKACNLGGESSESSPTTDAALDDNTTYTVWIDQWTHELEKVEVIGVSGTGSDTVNINSTTDMTYDPKVKVESPADAISLEEFVERYEAVIKDLGIGGSELLGEEYEADLKSGISNPVNNL